MIFVQPNMQQQEELAALFSRNMTFQPVVDEPKGEPRVVYISQHYNHSAHTTKPQTAEDEPSRQVEPAQQDIPLQAHTLSPRPASEPPQPDHGTLVAVLREHGVDPSGLSASQLQLFKTAEEPQQRRLIELWRICPPTNCVDNPTLAWCFTTVDQEEVLARVRYEQRQRAEQEEAERHRQAEEVAVLSMDGTPLTPIQAGDGRWMPTMPAQTCMEPYMRSGYEEMARREYEASTRRAYAEALERQQQQQQKEIFQPFGSVVGGMEYSSATDPVYQTTNGGLDWKSQVAMEDRYGRLMQSRNEDEEML